MAYLLAHTQTKVTVDFFFLFRLLIQIRAPVLTLSICEIWGKPLAITSLVILLWTMEVADVFSICNRVGAGAGAAC